MKAIFLVLAVAVAPAAATERVLTVTDFDRLRVDGGFIVEVAVGRSTSARVIGTSNAIDGVSVAVLGRTLTIRRNTTNWTGNAQGKTIPATIRITAPVLTNVWVTGPAQVRVDAMKGLRVGLSLAGSGSLTVGTITTDQLDLGMLGSGRITAAGTAAGMTATNRGSGEFDAGKLTVADARLTSESAGNSTIYAKRSANVTATGSGNVTVLGKPACTVKNIGTGNVTCGSDQS